MTRHPDDQKAAALSYKKGDYAPRVIAKGHGAVAEAIISLAHPAFRDDLIAAAGKLGIWRRSNRVASGDPPDASTPQD